MTLKNKLIAMFSALAFSAGAWSSDTSITQVWLNVDESYRISLPDLISLDDTATRQDFSEVCVGIIGVNSTPNVDYSITATSSNFNAVDNRHQLRDSASPTTEYVKYQLYWGLGNGGELSNGASYTSDINAGEARTNYANIISGQLCSYPIALGFKLDEQDRSAASGSYTDNITIILSGN